MKQWTSQTNIPRGSEAQVHPGRRPSVPYQLPTLCRHNPTAAGSLSWRHPHSAGAPCTQLAGEHQGQHRAKEQSGALGRAGRGKGRGQLVGRSRSEVHTCSTQRQLQKGGQLEREERACGIILRMKKAAISAAQRHGGSSGC